MGAVCGSSARTDLCGGRPVTRVPTAIINIRHTPSYQGGELIEKAGSALLASTQAALRELELASENHAAAKRAHGIDPYVTKANLDRATTQCQLELVKAARSRPIAYGDLGVINLMRHGRP